MQKDKIIEGLTNKISSSKATPTTWNLKLLFSSDDDSKMQEKRKFIEQKTEEFVNKYKKNNDYLTDSALLKQALDDYEDWFKSCGFIRDEAGDSQDTDEGFYFWLKLHQDQTDSKTSARFNDIVQFAQKQKAKINFFPLSLAKIKPEYQKIFLEEKNLKNYNHFLKRLFEKSKYQLGEQEEKLIRLKHLPSHENWVKLTSSLIYAEEKEVLLEDKTKAQKTLTQISPLTVSKNKQVRDLAVKQLHDIISKHIDVAEQEINSILLNKKIEDELRGFIRPDQSRHLNDDIETKIVDALLERVTKRYDLSKKFYQLKAKLFGVKKLDYYEKNVEYGNLDKTYTYEDSVKLVYKVLKNIDEEFAQIAKNLIENGQIDAYPKKGKPAGAFCTEEQLNQPTYILLNHNDKLRNVIIFAHELGHAIQKQLTRKKQNALNFAMPSSIAEIPSTFFEDYILEELIAQADDELKLAIIMMKLKNDIGSIQTQVACYKFEQELHKSFKEKNYLSKEQIGQIFQKHMKAYMGEEFIEHPKQTRDLWVTWMHIRLFFYVYTYALGQLASKYLQKKLKEDSSFIAKIKEFFSTGLSDSPKNILSKLGIDLESKQIWEEGLKEQENLLIQAEELAKKLGKI